ncbi:MAG: Ig-like domain-containing protein [Ruminococcus sp.]|nr:Ig-like domain-containing protein [Ruminococcus sp.]
MKKITSILIAVLMLLTSAVCASAKEYNFTDNNVIIVLTEEATQKVELGELKIDLEYFADSGLGITEIRCITMGIKPNIYVFTLDKHNHENVLKVAEILSAYEDIEFAEPNYYVTYGDRLSKSNLKLRAGETAKLRNVEFSVKSWKSSNKKIATVKDGKVTALNKGKVTITATASNGKKYTCKVNVSSAPKLTKNKKTVKTIKVKKGTLLKVKIKGKAKKINNKYTNTKFAKITSKKAADVIKVLGLKEGKTTLKIKVNGVKTLKLKVKVI